jgi:hypothetical protein
VHIFTVYQIARVHYDEKLLLVTYFMIFNISIMFYNHSLGYSLKDPIKICLTANLQQEQNVTSTRRGSSPKILGAWSPFHTRLWAIQFHRGRALKECGDLSSNGGPGPSGPSVEPPRTSTPSFLIAFANSTVSNSPYVVRHFNLWLLLLSINLPQRLRAVFLRKK